METKQELLHKIKVLEDELKPLKEELNKIYIKESQDVEEQIRNCEQLKGKFELSDLVFASHARCVCGAGRAYPKNIGIHGSWYCSAILLGRAERGSTHDGALPFAFYEIKSENQPSAKGVTTRPNE